MTVARVTLDQIEARPLVERKRWGKLVMNLLTTTDHKVIGNMYFVTSLIYFAFAGLLALAIRAELAYPGLQFLHYETFNQFFTMHGIVMVFFFLIPSTPAVLGNFLLPLMIGAKDLQLKQWTITDPQGFDTTVAVYNLDPAKKIDPGMFKIDYTDYNNNAR